MKRLLLVWAAGVLLAGLELAGLLLARELLAPHSHAAAPAAREASATGPDFRDALRFPLR